MDWFHFLVLLNISILVGIVGVIGGFGGGVFLVPILVINYPVEIAVGNSLLSLFLPSLLATYRNSKHKEVNFKLGIIFEIPTAIGTIIGANLTIILPSIIIHLIFGCIAILMAILLINRLRSDNLFESTRSNLMRRLLKIGPQIEYINNNHSYRIGIFILVIVGVGTGILAGMLGVGAGWIKTPFMISGFGIPPHIASATATFMITITSATGGIIHFLHGNISFIIIPITIGLVIGSEIGCRIRTRINNRQICIVLIVSLLLIGFIMIMKPFLM